jgi:hypothetical protein
MGALALGLFCCPLAPAQQRYPVYVDIDLQEAERLATRAVQAIRPQAYDDLRARLTATMKSLPRLGCWDLKPWPTNPTGRAATYHVLKVKFYITSPRSLSTSELYAVPVLTSSENPDEEVSLLKGRPQPLFRSGETEGLLNQDWEYVHQQIDMKFGLVFPADGKDAPDLLLKEGVPVAWGLAESVPGGATLPIEFAGFRKYAASLFMIAYGDAMNPDPKVWITSQGMADGGRPWPGHKGSYVCVHHEYWDKQAYNPCADDAKLKGYTPLAVYLWKILSGPGSPLTRIKP